MDRNITDSECYQNCPDSARATEEKKEEKKHWNKFHNLFLSHCEPNLVSYRLFRFCGSRENERESKAF